MPVPCIGEYTGSTKAQVGDVRLVASGGHTIVAKHREEEKCFERHPRFVDAAKRDDLSIGGNPLHQRPMHPRIVESRYPTVGGIRAVVIAHNVARHLRTVRIAVGVGDFDHEGEHLPGGGRGDTSTIDRAGTRRRVAAIANPIEQARRTIRYAVAFYVKRCGGAVLGEPRLEGTVVVNIHIHTIVHARAGIVADQHHRLPALQACVRVIAVVVGTRLAGTGEGIRLVVQFVGEGGTAQRVHTPAGIDEACPVPRRGGGGGAVRVTDVQEYRQVIIGDGPPDIRLIAACRSRLHGIATEQRRRTEVHPGVEHRYLHASPTNAVLLAGSGELVPLAEGVVVGRIEGGRCRGGAQRGGGIGVQQFRLRVGRRRWGHIVGARQGKHGGVCCKPRHICRRHCARPALQLTNGAGVGVVHKKVAQVGGSRR